MHTRAEHAQKNHQHPLARRNAARRNRFVGRRPEQHLGQAQPAPQDQQERPVFRQIIQQRQLGVKIARQKQTANGDQQQRRDYKNVSCVSNARPFGQLKQAEHNQQHRPGASEAEGAKLIQRQQHSQRNHQNRSANGAHEAAVHLGSPSGAPPMRRYSI